MASSPAPTGFLVKPLDKALKISWAHANVDDYDINEQNLYLTDVTVSKNDPASGHFQFEIGVTQNSYTVDNLINGHEYVVSLQASYVKKDDVNNVIVETVNFDGKVSPSTKPAQPNVSMNGSDGKVTIRFNDLSKETAFGYKKTENAKVIIFYRKESDTKNKSVEVKVSDIEAANNKFDLTDVENGKAHELSVVFVNENGTSKLSESFVVTPSDTPIAPAWALSKPIENLPGSYNLKLNWQPSDSLSLVDFSLNFYNIYRAERLTSTTVGPYTKLDTINAFDSSNNEVVSYEDQDLAAKEYFYKITVSRSLNGLDC
jgi:hypothetical protein